MYFRNGLFATAAGLAMLSGSAQAVIEISAGSATNVNPGDVVAIPLVFDCQGGETPEAAQWDIEFDPSVFSNVDTSDCISDQESGLASCSVVGDGDAIGVGTDAVRVSLLNNPAANVCPDNNPSAGAVGTVSFTVDVGAAPQTIPLVVADTVIDGNPPTNLVDGSITLQISGSFYSSTPAADGTGTLSFAPTVANTAASPEVVTVTNPGDAAFNVTGVNIAAPLTNADVFNINVAAGGSQDVTFGCTPTTRGTVNGTFEITHDAAGGASSPVTYNYDCTGLAPNTQVSSTTITLDGVVGGTNPTGSINVLNPSGNFTSDANNAVVNTTTDAAEISATSDVLADSTISVDEVDSLGYQCSTAAEGTFTEEFQIDYDDPISGGTASTATVTVTCQISDTAPIYNSAPMPGTLIALVTGANSQSPPDGLDINNDNTNPAGDALVISSAVASDPVFTVNVVNSSFDANVAADGNDDIEVTCTPPGVGTINGTLTVQTNASNQPGGGFTYPLSCEGTGDALTTNPDDRGTLNLGTVPPGTTTGEGLINFTNNQIDGDITVDCSVTDTAGVFTFTPDPILFTIPAGDTESAAFQCTPSDISSFTADVSCTLPVRGQGLNFTVACAGRPLVIPTMSRWGLVVMSLVLLLVAGVAGRRMLA